MPCHLAARPIAATPFAVPPPPPPPPALPAALHEFLALFNRGEYWESHEVLERPWRRNRSDFYKGLILLASALVHAERGNRHGIVAQLRKAIPLLERYRPYYLGLDVEAILSRVARALAWLEGPAQPEGGAPAARPSSLESPSSTEALTSLRLAISAEHIGGDEPELREGETSAGR